MTKVRLSDAARAYVRDEVKYLRERSPSAAKALTATMRKARANLAAFSELGFVKEGLPIPGMRRLVVGNYLLDYEISGDAVLIAAIRHGRQMPPDIAPDDDFDFERRD